MIVLAFDKSLLSLYGEKFFSALTGDEDFDLLLDEEDIDVDELVISCASFFSSFFGIIVDSGS